jgi:dihydrolipoamide dehydrogenase
MQVKVPDIGDFAEVPVIEILVEVGQEVAKEDPLVALESDKATMEVPSPAAGKVGEILVSVGDKVSEGTPLLTLEGGDDDSGEDEDAPEADAKPDDSAPAEQKGSDPDDSAETESSAEEQKPEVGKVVVIGGGPGGYTAAFRAADLGLDVTLVERHERLGGVCLNVGCIPSKALLHLARVVAEAEEAAGQGIDFGEPQIDLDRVRAWKDEVIGKLTGGLDGLAKRRKVEVVHGHARFTGPNAIDVDGKAIEFTHCIVAVGSSPADLPFLPEEDDRVMDSTGALGIEEVPERLLVIGGGIIGLEMATVYDALGAKVTVVELTDQLIPGCDPDLVKPLHKRISERYEAIHLGVGVKDVKAQDDGLHVTFDGDVEDAVYDRILVAVGRRPNGKAIAADKAGIEVDDRGFITVDEQMRTNVPHIHAIGDVVGEPMLAHKAMHEGKVAAEVIAGEKVAFEPGTIPAVAYTDPEIARMGLTEGKAKEEGAEVDVAKIPWAASGRALTMGRPEGMTKILVEKESRRVVGMGIVGVNAGELIAEAVLALEMGADAQDLALTIHPHPTLSETPGLAAEMAEGVITDLYAPKRR